MRPWTWVRRILALVVMVVFTLGVLASPALAKRGFSGAGRGFSSGSRSFSVPKSAPKIPSPSRSFSKPKVTTPAPSTSPSRSFSTKPPPATSTDSKTYTSPDSKSFSSGSRSFSSPFGSFSSKKPAASGTSTAPNVTTPPMVSYDTSKTRYPTMPPVVVMGPTVFDPWYYHDYYYGRPWYWRMWHRPYYTATGGWALSWVSIVVGLVVLWFVLGVLSSIIARRRRNR